MSQTRPPAPEASHARKAQGRPAGAPWWKFPIVWLVVGGPAVVVVAGIATVVIAVKHVDPVLDTSASQPGSRAEQPAMQGRNRAAQESSQDATQPADR